MNNSDENQTNPPRTLSGIIRSDVLDAGMKEEVSSFFQQLLEKTFELKAERVRFEADESDIFLRFYAKRELLKSYHLRSHAIEIIWRWLMAEAFASYHPTVVETPMFQGQLPFKDGCVIFSVQRSKTLRRKTSLLLWDFFHYPKGIENRVQVEDPVTEIKIDEEFFSTSDNELEELGRMARKESAALTRPIVYTKPYEPSNRDPKQLPLVLICEDQDDQRLLMRKALERAQYRVQEARNGEEALRILRTSKPDLLVTDLMMPKIDGSELVKRIRHNPEFRNLPIMVFTVISDPMVEFDILDLGADDYCEKTESPKVFLKRLENLLVKAPTSPLDASELHQQSD